MRGGPARMVSWQVERRLKGVAVQPILQSLPLWRLLAGYRFPCNFVRARRPRLWRWGLVAEAGEVPWRCGVRNGQRL